MSFALEMIAMGHAIEACCNAEMLDGARALTLIRLVWQHNRIMKDLAMDKIREVVPQLIPDMEMVLVEVLEPNLASLLRHFSDVALNTFKGFVRHAVSWWYA